MKYISKKEFDAFQWTGDFEKLFKFLSERAMYITPVSDKSFELSHSNLLVDLNDWIVLTDSTTQVLSDYVFKERYKPVLAKENITSITVTGDEFNKYFTVDVNAKFMCTDKAQASAIMQSLSNI
ncbi:MAG: hypothetical protein WC783_00495 [Candidatus Paceibacterota bacterium]|jgi:hypothetical protein